MNIIAKKALTQTVSFVVGVGMIAANGTFMLTQNQPTITHADPIAEDEQESGEETTVKDFVSLSSAEKSAVNTISAADLPSGTDMTKASLSDYTMLLKAEKSDEASTDSDDTYDVVYALDSTEIYDPQPEAMNFTDTRSIANEYYTVYDIISGSTVTLNAYELICEMVYSEIGASWDEDAIKAQAVAAYSYVRFNDANGLSMTVGLKSGYPSKIEKCVSAVEGQAVFYDGKIINAVYSASTAGYTIESERIWDVYYPYLRAVVSEYDSEDPNYGIEYVYTTDEVRKLIEDEYSITLSDDLSNWFNFEAVYSGRYVSKVSIDGQVTLTGREMKTLFGLKSQAFTITFSDDGETVTFKSYGWGHGVGMSQWGACYYAKHGYTYDQILRHYYLNTTIALSSENTSAVKSSDDDSDDASSAAADSSSASDTSSSNSDSSSTDSDSSSSKTDSSSTAKSSSSATEAASSSDSDDTFSSSDSSDESEDTSESIVD
ncbi:MAG: SpoIID/LytB domain-containing protein [Ruminococcus sp.]|nr:SpoIID/LytB domain-containing protein [Ruminococcus sp.]